MKKELKLAGTMNLAFAFLTYKYMDMTIYPLLLIALALFYFAYTKYTIPELNGKKTQLVILTIFNMIINIPTGIIMIIGNEKLKNEYNKSDKKEIEKKSLTQEEKKISILLNMGIGLVGLSGIILITTNWHAISDVVKVSILLFFALLFMSLSVLTENKLKIKVLSKNYWILGMLFIIFAVIGIGYFNIISPWFSLSGQGHYLYIAFTSIIISLLALLTKEKVKGLIYSNICYIGIITSISYILLHLNIQKEIVLAILTGTLLIINVIKNEKLDDIKDLSRYLTYGVSILSFLTMAESTNSIPSLVLSSLTIINLISITIDGTATEGIISALFINISILLSLATLDLPTKIINMVAIFVYAILYLINLAKIENKTFTTILNIIINLIMLTLIMVNSDDKLMLCLTTALITLTSVINYSKKTIKAENILLPIKTVAFLISIIVLLEEALTLNPIYIIIALYVIAFIIYKLLKNEKLKKLSIIIYYILLAISLMQTNGTDYIPCVLNLITISIIFAAIKIENNTTKTRIAYITLLITIAATIAGANPLYADALTNGVIILLLYVIMTIITRRDNDLNKISYLSILLPLLIMTEDYLESNDLDLMISTIQALYVVVLINMFIIKKEKDRNIVSTILIALIFSRIIYYESMTIGLFIGIISLILIMIGFIRKEYKGLFIEGIVFTIINLLVQFNYLLKELPLWIYTLLAGLLLIAIVTYKIIKDNKEK